MKQTGRQVPAGALCCALVLCMACSEHKPDERPTGDRRGAMRGTPDPNVDGGIRPTTPTDFGNSSQTGDPVMPMQTADQTPAFEDCASETQSAMQVDVDMYIMLDRSGSMLAETGAGDTKWDAIRSALTAFVQDPQSDGLGVGLQYFPLGVPGVPESCTSDAECGPSGGLCSNRACLPDPASSSFDLIGCVDDSNCPPGSPGCVPFGLCERDATVACTDFTRSCGVLLGSCVPLQAGCLGFASCDSVDYATPAVDIGVLPNHANQVVVSLMNEEPTGLTPTQVALDGAIGQARTHALANPRHRVLTVLATDGLPTDCVPQDVMTLDDAVAAVANVAADGVALAPSVNTYVIGVFSPEEPEAMQKLDEIALAGGTESAFIVDPTADVAQQFLDALSQIRGGSLACEFQLPTPPEGEEFDPMLVNVELTDETGSHELAYVGSASGCGQADLEWHYDTDPSVEAPSAIEVCDPTCDALKAAKEASVQIRVGCPTRGPD